MVPPEIIYSIVVGVVLSVITGAVSALVTISSIKVELLYLKEDVKGADLKATRAHKRIDSIENFLLINVHGYTHKRQSDKNKDLT